MIKDYLKIVLILVTLLIFPFVVEAKEQCDLEKVLIKEIQLERVAGNTEEKSSATINNNKVNLDVKMYDPGDLVEYKLVVENTSNEDFYFTKDYIQTNNDYINYEILMDNESGIIKAGTEENVVLRIQYKNKIPDNQLNGNSFTEDNQILLNFANEKDNILENPKTGRNIFISIILFSLLITLLVLFGNKKHVGTYIIIGILMVIPFTVYALCKFDLEINAKITIEKNKTCFYDGELVQGAEYINGQYTYRYMQEYNGNGNWSNMESDGWGIMLTDQESTDIVNTKMCTRINDKPITSMFATFYHSNASLIDVSSFDTSNVTNMRSMFIDSKSPEIIGLNSFNTSKVTSMRMMFRNCIFKSIDVSSFDTSNVTTMQSMFQGTKVEELNINHFNTQNVTDMQQMFHGLLIQELDISNLDLSNVTNVKSIFRDSSIKKVYVKDQDTFNKLNASSFKPSDLVIEIK